MIALKTTTDFLGAIQVTLGYAPQHLEPGRFCRFGPRKSGWAKLFADCLGGVFGDYRQNLSSHWSAHQARHQSPVELAAMRRHVEKAAREREAEQREQWVKNAERNAALWAASVPADDAVRSYLAARGLARWAIPSCIRQHEGLAYWHTDDAGGLHLLGHFPAMLAPIVSGGKLLAIHRTYLGDGCKADVPTPKKLTAAAGPLAGACIALAAPRGGVLGIAEGIETAAAASLGSGMPVVAAYCANALAGFTFPRGTERLVIFADYDLAGQQAAATLAHRATRAGLTPKTLTPSKPGSDWADVWLEGQQ
ncbi:MAG: toprim domain-containing protein [Giesbergeria sp.]